MTRFGEFGCVEGAFEALRHRSIPVDLLPGRVVLIAGDAFGLQAEPLPHDQQESVEGLDRGRDFTSLEARDPRLASRINSPLVMERRYPIEHRPYWISMTELSPTSAGA